MPQGDQWRSDLASPPIGASADARYIAFTSFTALVPADTNSRADIYVLDRSTGSVGLESLAPDGQVSDVESTHPRLSGEGHLLVYETGRPAWAESSLRSNVLLRDRRTSMMTLIGTPVEPGSAGDRSHSPVISADGRFVAFVSTANPTRTPDANRVGEDVYLFEVATAVTRRISVNEAGEQPATGASGSPSISADGRHVAFASHAPLSRAARGDLRAVAPGRPAPHVYVRDLASNVTRLVSVTSRGVPANGASWGPAINASGRHVAFVSIATNLASGDRNGVADVFIADLQSGSVELVSVSARGGSANGSSGSPALSADGRFVAFQSDASDLVCASACPLDTEDINLLWDVFLLDRQARTITRMSTDPAGGWMEASVGPAIDAAGRVVAFSSRHPTGELDNRNDFDLFIRATPSHGQDEPRPRLNGAKQARARRRAARGVSQASRGLA